MSSPNTTTRTLKLRALIASLAILLGFVAAPASLAFGQSAGCVMACCLEHGDGETASECCALRHAGAQGKAAFQTEMASKCPANCASTPSNAQLYPRGVNRPIAALYDDSSSSDSLFRNRERHHRSRKLAPKSPRAPPDIR